MSHPNSPNSSLIGVVTVTYNAESLLEDFFTSLKGQSFTRLKVYVVDNASKDGTLALLRGRYANDCVLVANSDNLGVAEGNNQGIRAALADGCTHVMLINNDTAFDANLFELMLNASFERSAAIVVPKIPFYSDPTKLWFAGGYFDKTMGFSGVNEAHGELDAGQRDTARAISFAPTCCMLVRKDVFSRVGLMDERYFVYFDDNDFSLRAFRAGDTLWYLPSAKILHKVGQSTAGDNSPFSIRYMVRNRVYFVRKHYRFLRQTIFLFYILCAQVVKGLLGRSLSQRLNAYKEGFFLPLTTRHEVI